MNNAVNVGMCLEDLVKILLFSDVDIVELRSFATDEFDAVDDFFGGVVEIVCYHDLVACFE